MTLETRIGLLKAASGFTIAFGAMAVLSLFTGLHSIMALFFDLAIGSAFDGLPAITGPETRLLIAIMGGLMAGLGVMIWMLAETVYRQDKALGQRIIITGLAVWYVIDSGGSAIVGSWQNVLSNTVFLELFLLPLMWPGKSAKAAV